MFPRILEIKKNLQLLKDKLKKIEKHIHNLIQTTQRFKQIEDILVTVPGIGNRSITGLLCYLPELGKVTRKQITALCGLALYVCDSGQMRGKARTKKGRAHIKEILYMPMLTSIRINPIISRFYQHLRSRGKPAKVALIACMRKLLTILNFLVKNKVSWKACVTK